MVKLTILIILFFGTVSITYAGWIDDLYNFLKGVEEEKLGAPIHRYERNIMPETDSTYDIGTSTAAWYKIQSDQFCLTGDSCISSWSAGAAFAWTPATNYNENTNSTTTPIWLKDSLYASSTSFFDGLLTAKYASSTNFTSDGDTWLAVTNGNVGIGTTSPDRLLTLEQQADDNGIKIYGYEDKASSYGEMRLDNNGDFDLIASGSINLRPSMIKFYASSRIYDEYTFRFGSDEDFSIGYSDGEDYLQFVDGASLGSSVRMVIDNNGNVGIGTTSPWALLSVNAPAGQASFAIGSSTGSHLVVDKSGNVGIGTTSPSQVLAVNGNVLADAFLEYSPLYIGDAVSAIKNIKSEIGTENGNWAKVDHSTLPMGVKVKGTNFIGRDLGKNVQLNTRAIQQLIDRVEQLETKMKLEKGHIGGIMPEVEKTLWEKIKSLFQ